MKVNIYHFLLVNSADDKFMIFSYYFQKIDLNIPCKLSPLETICIECQSLFSGINKKKNK